MATKKKATKKKATKKKATKKKTTKKKATKKKATKKKATKKKAAKKKAAKKKATPKGPQTVTALRKIKREAAAKVEKLAEQIARAQGINKGGVSLNEELANRGLRKEASREMASRYDICNGTRRVLHNVHAGEVWEWLAQAKINKKFPSAATEAERNKIRKGTGATDAKPTTLRERAAARWLKGKR